MRSRIFPFTKSLRRLGRLLPPTVVDWRAIRLSGFGALITNGSSARATFTRFNIEIAANTPIHLMCIRESPFLKSGIHHFAGDCNDGKRGNYGRRISCWLLVASCQLEVNAPTDNGTQMTKNKRQTPTTVRTTRRFIGRLFARSNKDCSAIPSHRARWNRHSRHAECRAP